MRRHWKLVTLAAYLVLLAASHAVRHFRSPPSPREGQATVTVAGKRIAYWDLGPQDAPVLLLIHGTPGASPVFEAVAKRLEDRYRLIIPDLPGFGRSEQKVGDLSIAAHADDLRELIRHLGVASVTAVGYSMGGGVALHLAEQSPESIDAIILLASIGVQEHELLGDYVLNHALHSLQLAVITLIQEGVPHFGWWDDTFFNRNYARNFTQTDQRPLRSLLKKWQGPTLIIHGENDHLVPSSAAIEHARIVPQAELRWIEGGNHIDLMRRPGEVAALIAGFVENPGPVRDAAAPERKAAAEKPPVPRHLDQTLAGAIGSAALLAMATMGSEDLTCISGGILTSRGVLRFATATAGCFTGIFLGDLLLFLLGRWFGARAMDRAPLRWIVNREKIDAGKIWLHENGAKVIVISRFLPGARLPVYVGMGAAGVKLGRFVFWFLLAAAIWTPLLVGLSALFGQALLPWFEENEKYILVGMIAMIAGILTMIRLVSSIATWRGRRLLYSRWRRLTGWEFWPGWIIYLALSPYLFYLAVRHRSFTVFAAANPALPCGGFALEPKLISLNALEPSGSVGRFRAVSQPDDVARFMEEESLDFPIVLKPNIGDRGKGVAIVRSAAEVAQYFSILLPGDAVVAQEYIEGPEFGVFYTRHPGEERGNIFAITRKELITLTGDGETMLEDLILRHPRAVCMAPFFFEKYHEQIDHVPDAGEEILLTPLGTHSRGALFLDGTDLATPQLEEEMDRICGFFEGFHFGRFDLRAPSIEAFQAGENLRIIEVNGVTSEATGMYDPKHSLIAALSILAKQWKTCYEIGAANRKRGCHVPSLRELLQNVKEYRMTHRFESPVS